LKKSSHDRAAVIAAGITLHEALAAYELLKQEGICIRVIDAYSIKPLDRETLAEATQATKAVITVEDHFAEGGLGEAVRSALSECAVTVHALAVTKKPMSGTPAELLDYEGISRQAIVRKVKELVKTRQQ
jgi:transketolase